MACRATLKFDLRPCSGKRDRKGEVICGLLYEEALQGRMYTMTHFAETFENTGGLGGQSIIRERLNVLTTKGYVKFVRGAAAAALDLATERSKYGYLCVETMRLATSREHVDPSIQGNWKPENPG